MIGTTRPQSAFSIDNCNGTQLGVANSSSSPSLASILRDKVPTKKSVTLNDDKVDVHEFTEDSQHDNNHGPTWDPANKPEGTIWSRFERRRPMFRPHNHRYHVSSAVSVPNLSVIPEIEHDSSSINDSTHSISAENSQRTDSRSTLSQSQSISFGLDLLPVSTDAPTTGDASTGRHKLAQASNISVSSSAISLSNESDRSGNRFNNSNCHENVNSNRNITQHGSCLCLHSTGPASNVGTLPSYVYQTPHTLANGALTLDSAMRYRYLTFGSSTQLQREYYDKHPQTPAGWPSLAEFRFRRKLRRFKRQARKFIGNVSLKRFVKPNTRLASVSTLNLSRNEPANPQMSRASSLTSLLDLIEEANQNLVNQYNRSPQAPPKCPPRKLKRAQSSINFSTLATKDSSDGADPGKPNDPNATRARVQSILNDLGLLTKPKVDNYRIAFINNDQRNRMQAQNGLNKDKAPPKTGNDKTVIDSNNNSNSSATLPAVLDAKQKERNSKILCVRSHFEINNGTVYLEDSDWEMCSEISETLNSLGNMDSVVSIENNKNSDKSGDSAPKSLEISICSESTLSPDQPTVEAEQAEVEEKHIDCSNSDSCADPEETLSHASLNNSSGFGSETEVETKETPKIEQEKDNQQLVEKRLETFIPKMKVEPIYSRVQKPVKVSKPAKVDFKPKIVRHDCCGHGRKPTPIDTGLHNSHTESSRAKVVHSTGTHCHRIVKPKGPAPPPPPPPENRCTTESTRLCRTTKPEVIHKKPRLNIKSALVTRGFIPSLKRKQTLKTVNESKNEKDDTEKTSKRNRSPLLSLMDRFSPTKADSKVDNRSRTEDILEIEDDSDNTDCDDDGDDDDGNDSGNREPFDSIENETFPDILPVDKTIYEEIQPRTPLGSCSVNELIEKFEQLPLKSEPTPVECTATRTKQTNKESVEQCFGTFNEMEKQFNHYLSDLAPPGVDAQQLDRLAANLMKEFENKMTHTNSDALGADCATSAGPVFPAASAGAQNSNFLLFFFLHNQRKMFKEILVEMMGTIQKQQQHQRQQQQQQSSLVTSTNESIEFKRLLNILQTNLQKQEVVPSSPAQNAADVGVPALAEDISEGQTKTQQCNNNNNNNNAEQQQKQHGSSLPAQSIENGNNASQTLSSENRFVNKIVLNNSINQFNFSPAAPPTANIVNALADACRNESQNTFAADMTNHVAQESVASTGNESSVQVQVKQPSGEQADEMTGEMTPSGEPIIVNKPHKTVLMITPGTNDGSGGTSGSFFSAIRSRFEKKRNRKALEKFKKQQIASSQLNLLETIAVAEARANSEANSKVTLVNTSTLEVTPNGTSSDSNQSTLKRRSTTVQIGQDELMTVSNRPEAQKTLSTVTPIPEKCAPTSKMSTLRRWLSSKDISKGDKKQNKSAKIRQTKVNKDSADEIESEPEMEIVKTLDHLVRRHRKSEYIPDVSEPLEWSQVSVRGESRAYRASSRVSISDSTTDRSLMGSASHSISGMDGQFDTSRAAKYRRRATGAGLPYRSASVIRLDTDYSQHCSSASAAVTMRNSDSYNSRTNGGVGVNGAGNERRRRYGSQNNLSAVEHYSHQHFEPTNRSTMRFESTSDDESEATTVSTCRSKIVSFHLPRNDRPDVAGKHHTSGRQTSMNYRLADEHYHRNETNFYRHEHDDDDEDDDEDGDDDDDDDDEDDENDVNEGEEESNSDSTVEQASSDAETINTSSDDTNLEYYLTPSSRLNERYFRRPTNYKTKYY